MRAVAILAVVWHHTQSGDGAWAVSGRGFLGVDLFFAISGFLIVTLLLRERRRTGTVSLRRFYVRRFLRIFPPYYALLAAMAVIAFARPGPAADAVRHDLPYAVVYVSNMVPMASLLAITWSLSVEEQFYLVVPAFERGISHALPLILAAVYVLVSLPPFGLFAGLPLPAFFRETTFGPILLGVLLAHLLDAPRGYRLVARALGHRYASAVVLAVTLLVCNHPASDISGGPRLAMQWAMLLLVAAAVVRDDHALAPALESWPMRRIGAVSYGIYLYHLVVRAGVDRALKAAGVTSEFVEFAATATATWIVAEGSYRWFESRFLALKARWS